MGGGGTITRAAAKVAGLGAARGGLRGSSASALSSEHSAGSASRVVSVGIVSSHTADAPSALAHRSAAAWDWEVDDWEFAECDSDSARSAAEPRVVFGGTPSYEEAEAATAELKDAVEKVYLSSDNSASLGDSVPVNQESIMSILPNRGTSTKSYVPIESALVSPVPAHAVQAFSMLSQNPAAKSIVASIASDPNVWTAVLQNEAFMDYVQSQRTRSIIEGEGPSDVTSEVADSEDWKSPKFADSFMFEDNNPLAFENIEDSLKNMFQNIKLSVTEMVTTVSGYLNNFFGFPGPEKFEENNGLTGSILLDRTVGASFMGLAVLVVMIVLLRRV